MKSPGFLFLVFLAWMTGCASHSSMERRRGEIAPRSVFVPVWERTMVRGSRFARVPDQFGTPTWSSGTLRIVTGTSRGEVWSMDLTGGTLWRVALHEPVEAPPLVRDDVVLVGTISGGLHALDRETGRKLWKFQGYGSFLGHMLVNEGVVYALSSRNKLYAVALETGALHWSREHETPQAYTVRGHSSLVLRRNLLIYGLSDGRLMAIDLQRRGEIYWTADLEDGADANYLDADATPILFEDRLFAASYRKGVVSLAVDTGEVEWRYPIAGVTRLLLHRERLYFVSASSGIHCLSLDGRLLWRQHVELGTATAMQVVNDRLLISFDEGGLIALNPYNGYFYQKFDTGSGISGGFAVTGPWLATLANNGRLYLFEIR
jgi:outer membrane protein assembly factor BamB